MYLSANARILATSANGRIYVPISVQMVRDALMASISASAIYLLSMAIALTASAGNANASKRMKRTKMNTMDKMKSSNFPPGVMPI
jgi:hypothetical protein